MWSLFSDIYVFSWVSFICGMIWTGETGGATHLTSMGPPAPPVLPAMEEAARTTSATKVCRKWAGGRRTQGPFSSHCTLFLLFYSKMTAQARHKRKQRKTTSLSRRPLAVRRSPGPGPVPPPKPLSSPPQRQKSCKGMKWSTHNRCVSCHFYCLFWISFHLKLDGEGFVLGLGGARAAMEMI